MSIDFLKKYPCVSASICMFAVLGSVLLVNNVICDKWNVSCDPPKTFKNLMLALGGFTGFFGLLVNCCTFITNGCGYRHFNGNPRMEV